MMKIKVRNAPEVAAAIKDLPEIIKKSLNNAMFTTGTNIQKTASEILAQPYPSGTASHRQLHQSIEMTSDHAARRYEIGSRLHYAKHVEFGTGPHTSSSGMAEFESSLREWYNHVNPSAPYAAVKKAIQRHGTPPKPYLRPAFVKERENFPYIFVKELKHLLPPSIKA